MISLAIYFILVPSEGIVHHYDALPSTARAIAEQPAAVNEQFPIGEHSDPGVFGHACLSGDGEFAARLHHHMGAKVLVLAPHYIHAVGNHNIRFADRTIVGLGVRTVKIRHTAKDAKQKNEEYRTMNFDAGKCQVRRAVVSGGGGQRKFS